MMAATNRQPIRPRNKRLRRIGFPGPAAELGAGVSGPAAGLGTGDFLTGKAVVGVIVQDALQIPGGDVDGTVRR